MKAALAEASRAAAQNHSAFRPQKGVLVLLDRLPAANFKRFRAEKGDTSLSNTPLSTVEGASEGEQAESGAKQDEAARLRRGGNSDHRLR